MSSYINQNFNNPNYNYTRNSQYPHSKPTVIVTNAYGVQVHNSNDPPQYPQQSNQLPQQQQQQQQLVDEANSYGWRAYNKKNRPQSNSITSACMIASASGIHFTYVYAYFQYLSLIVDSYLFTHILISWFIGVILGSFFSAFLVRKIQKKYFNYLASILTVASGILFVYQKIDIDMIILVRYISGIAYGLIIIPVIIHAGEISVKKLRGQLISNINLCFTSGIICGSIFCLLANEYVLLDINQLCGIPIIIFGIMSFIYNIFMITESPFYFIDHNNENQAFINFLKLRSEKFETINNRYEFNDNIKDMYNDDIILNSFPLNQRNFRPLILIGILRILYALITSIPLNCLYYFYYENSIVFENLQLYLMLIRLISEIISWCLIDYKGRRHILIISLLLSGICIILTAIVYYDFNIHINNSIMILAFFLQFFIGLGLNNVSLTYMSEAFPFVKKPTSLLLITIFENLIHIFVIYTFINFPLFNIKQYFYAIGILSVLYSFIAFKLPDTKNLTLRQCRNVMR